MMKLPAEEYMVAFCPRAKDGFCDFWRDWWPRSVVTKWHFQSCTLDETVRVGQIIWQERFRFPEPPTETASEIEALLQTAIDRYVQNTFGLPNYHLKIKGIVLQIDQIQIFFKASCPRFITRYIRREFFKSKTPELLRWGRKHALGTDSALREKLAKLYGGVILPTEFPAFKQAYLAFIARKFPTWELVV